MSNAGFVNELFSLYEVVAVRGSDQCVIQTEIFVVSVNFYKLLSFLSVS